MHLSFQIWALLAVAAATLVILGLAAINAFGRVAQRRLGAPTLSLPVQPDQTPLDRAIAPLMAERPAESGLLLLTSSPAALRARLETARLAGRSLDLQYYFWKSDLSGQLLMREVVAAAERGVRVRLLLDDINSFGFDPSLLALDSHPNIEVRLFNPSRSRTNSSRRGLELTVGHRAIAGDERGLVRVAPGSFPKDGREVEAHIENPVILLPNRASHDA